MQPDRRGPGREKGTKRSLLLMKLTAVIAANNEHINVFYHEGSIQ